MLAGNHRRELLEAVDRLGAELGCSEGPEVVDDLRTPLGGASAAMGGILNSEDEEFVATLRRGLARIATALGAGGGAGHEQGNAVGAALDGAEMVTRGELIMGNGGQLPSLLPGFVYLVVLPVVGQDRALAVSERAQQLIGGALGPRHRN